MAEISHRFVETNGIRMHIAEAGSGPLVLLLHGFPESWYSWRHQLLPLADAGYHVVAPDQRGYCGTDRPDRIEDYTILHLVGDVIGLIDALGEEQAVVVGHDWGAPVAWHTAQLRPDRVRGVAGLSVPHRPRSSRPPISLLREAYGDGFYIVYFQQPGIADAELALDPRTTFRRMLYAASGDAAEFAPIVPEGGGFLDICPDPGTLPGWLTEEDLSTFVTEYEPSGFTGPLNWYRNWDRNWELTAAWHRAPITPPALYIAGDRDVVATAPGSREMVAGLPSIIPNLREPLWLEGCGHWTQQERPQEVTAALLGFLGELG
jgi:pimeloyl-ACP methyl ester carboxylesterase